MSRTIKAWQIKTGDRLRLEGHTGTVVSEPLPSYEDAVTFCFRYDNPRHKSGDRYSVWAMANNRKVMLGEPETTSVWTRGLVVAAKRDRTDLAGADLSGIDLSGVDLAFTFLSGTNLSGTDLSRAILVGAYLQSANLTDANLTDAYLQSANLTDANLTDANLTDANLTDANLTNACLTGAKLTGARLTGVFGLTAEGGGL